MLQQNIFKDTDCIQYFVGIVYCLNVYFVLSLLHYECPCTVCINTASSCYLFYSNYYVIMSQHEENSLIQIINSVIKISDSFKESGQSSPIGTVPISCIETT